MKIFFALTILFLSVGFFCIPSSVYGNCIMNTDPSLHIGTPLIYGTYTSTSVSSPVPQEVDLGNYTLMVNGSIYSSMCSNDVFQQQICVTARTFTSFNSSGNGWSWTNGSLNPQCGRATISGGSSTAFSIPVFLPPDTPCGPLVINIKWQSDIYAKGSTTTNFCYYGRDGADINIPIIIGAAGHCGSASGGSSVSKPTTNLCTSDSHLVGSVTGSGPWSWTCTNNANAVCNTPTICSTNLASQGQCNPASAKVWDAGSTSFTDNFCSTPGNPTPNYPFFPTADFPTSTWTCPGPNGGPTSNTCTATLNVNGVCGPAAQP